MGIQSDKMEKIMTYKLVNLQVFGDKDGSLISLESNKNVPFDIKRVYYIFGTAQGVRRGKHAHQRLKQLVICTSGSCKFLLDDGKSKDIVELSKPNEGLFLESLVWREMFDFSPDCVLMVLASAHYDEEEYIRNYDEFLEKAGK